MCWHVLYAKTCPAFDLFGSTNPQERSRRMSFFTLHGCGKPGLYVYIPRTEMILVLVEKGLVLGDWPSKLAVIGVPGTCPDFMFVFAQVRQLPFSTSFGDDFDSARFGSLIFFCLFDEFVSMNNRTVCAWSRSGPKKKNARIKCQKNFAKDSDIDSLRNEDLCSRFIATHNYSPIINPWASECGRVRASPESSCVECLAFQMAQRTLTLWTCEQYDFHNKYSFQTLSKFMNEPTIWWNFLGSPLSTWWFCSTRLAWTMMKSLVSFYKDGAYKPSD